MIDRRQFIRSASATIGFTLLWLAGCGRSSSAPDTTATSTTPASTTTGGGTTAGTTTTEGPTWRRVPAGGLDPLHAVGQAYLTAVPGEGSTETLAGHLGIASEGIPGLRERLGGFATAARDDLGSGRVVTADGWLISITEGRLCALILLTE